MITALMALAVVAAWDASRRWSERGDAIEPEEYDNFTDNHDAFAADTEKKLETLTQAVIKLGGITEDHTKVLANHAKNLGEHGSLLTKLGLQRPARS